MEYCCFNIKGSFKKYVRRIGWGGGEGGVLKKWTKTNRGGMGGGQAYLYVRSCEKNCLIFKQQAEFFLISCLAVAKCFLFWGFEPNPANKGVSLLKRREHFFFSLNVFYEYVNICIVITYITVPKKNWSYTLSLQKN